MVKEQPVFVIRNKIHTFIRRLDFKVYVQYKVCGREKQKLMAVGTVNGGDLETLRINLCAFGFKLTIIDTPHYRGLYGQAPSGIYGLFLSPKREIISLNQDILNQTLLEQPIFELNRFGKEHGIEDLVFLEYEACLSLWACLDRVFAELLGISYPELLFTKYKNSHNQYIRNYLKLKRNAEIFHYDPEYAGNNIALFSWIYCLEVKITEELVRGETVSLHDTGTSLAHFPLLLSGLSCAQLFGLKIGAISASDKVWTGQGYIERILRENPHYRKIDFVRADLTKDMELLPESDVIILNDVLEHLPDDRTAFAVLHGLWNKAGRLLIAHVPLESEPNAAWDHHISFTPEKIRDWSRSLPGGCVRSDTYSAGDISLTALGFFIITKNNLSSSAGQRHRH